MEREGYFLRILTQDDVLCLLRKRQGEGTASSLAKEIGISAAYLSEIMRKTRGPNKAVLKFLGLQKQRTISVVYLPSLSNGRRAHE